MTDDERRELRRMLPLCEDAIREARATRRTGVAAARRDTLVKQLEEAAADGYEMLDPAAGRLRRSLAFLEDLIERLKRGETSPIRPPWTVEQAIVAFEKQVADGYAILRGEPETTEH